MNHPKLLAVISNSAVRHEDINQEVVSLLREMVREIKTCPSTRKGAELAFALQQASLLLPKQYSKEHVETKWERFARNKGIKKRKKDSLVYDEEIGEYVPRYGSHSKKNRTLKAGVKDGETTVSVLRRQKKRNIEKNAANKLANSCRRNGRS